MNSKNKKTWFKNGNSLLNLNRYSESIECYDKVIQLDPNYTKVWNCNKEYQGEYEKFEQHLV